MKRSLIVLILICIIILGCKPKISEDVREKLNKLLDEGDTLNALTEIGVNHTDYGEQLKKIKIAYSIVKSVWPSDFLPDVKDDLEKALMGWGLADYLWSEKAYGTPPIEPDHNNYQMFVSYYAADQLIFDIYPPCKESYTNPSCTYDNLKNYRGKKYVTFDNTSLLLSIASNDFLKAQSLVREEMK